MNQANTMNSQNKDNVIRTLALKNNEKTKAIWNLKEQLKRNNEHYKAMFQKKADEIKNLTTMNSMQSVRLENCRKGIREQTVALQEKDNQIQDLQKENNEIQKLTDENNQQLATIQNLEKKLQKMTAMTNKYERHLHKHSEWCKKTEEVKKLNMEMKLKNGEIEKVTMESDKKSETIKNLKKELQEKDYAIQVLANENDQIGNLKNKLKNMQHWFSDEKIKLEQRLENHSEWCQKTDEIKILEKELELRNGEIEEFITENNNLRVHLVTYEESLKFLSNELETSKAEISWWQHQFNSHGKQKAELQKKVESLELELVRIQDHFKDKELEWAKSWERLCYLEYAFDIHDKECPYAKEVKRLNEELRKKVSEAEAEKKTSNASYDRHYEISILMAREQNEQLEQELEDERKNTKALKELLAMQ